MVQLFAGDKLVILRHLNNIFKINKLEMVATVVKFATVQKEGEHEVTRYADALSTIKAIKVDLSARAKTLLNCLLESENPVCKVFK